MNNKKLGTDWEREVVDILKSKGYWAHFITPDQRGAQPFDIIAIKDDKAIAVECKTLSEKRRYFTIDRLEDNQIMAFHRWYACGNHTAYIAVKWGEKWTMIDFRTLERDRKVDMREGIR